MLNMWNQLYGTQRHDRATQPPKGEIGEIEMKRMAFTIKTKSGSNYDANHICSTYRDGDLHPMISFQCSGRMMTFPCEEVLNIIIGTADWCSECDQRLLNMSGSDNP